MFICQQCESQSQRGQKPTLIVVETREKVYPFRSHANPRWSEWSRPDSLADPGGKGIEIVKELRLCQSCVDSGLVGLSSRTSEVDSLKAEIDSRPEVEAKTYKEVLSQKFRIK